MYRTFMICTLRSSLIRNNYWEKYSRQLIVAELIKTAEIYWSYLACLLCLKTKRSPWLRKKSLASPCADQLEIPQNSLAVFLLLSACHFHSTNGQMSSGRCFMLSLPPRHRSMCSWSQLRRHLHHNSRRTLFQSCASAAWYSRSLKWQQKNW